MPEFELTEGLSFNWGPIADPGEYARENGCRSWLFLCGQEFAEMDGGISFEQVAAAVPTSVNVISDPPRILDLKLAKQHVAALDELPRPTLVSCRAGPRASAVAYMYSGLKQGTDPEEVLAAADRHDAPFAKKPEYREWVVNSIRSLRKES